MDCIKLIVTDETQRIKNKLYDELKEDCTLEQFWQTRLQKVTGLRHERLDHGLITDLSDHNVLIEIKNGSGFREAFGQIAVYSYLKARRGCSSKLTKIIVIFNADWTEPMRLDYEAICKQSNIHLILFDERNIRDNNFDALIKLIREDCKQIDFRERIESFRHRQTLKEFLLRDF